MKNTFKKFLCLTLCMVMMFSVFSVSFVSNAAETEEESVIMPRYSTISGYSVGFDVSGFTATATVTLSAQVSTNLKIVIYLQKETSDGYETVKTWTHTDTGYATGVEKEATANIFYNYRIKVVMTAGSETITVFRYE